MGGGAPTFFQGCLSPTETPLHGWDGAWAPACEGESLSPASHCMTLLLVLAFAFLITCLPDHFLIIQQGGPDCPMGRKVLHVVQSGSSHNIY